MHFIHRRVGLPLEIPSDPLVLLLPHPSGRAAPMGLGRQTPPLPPLADKLFDKGQTDPEQGGHRSLGALAPVQRGDNP